MGLLPIIADMQNMIKNLKHTKIGRHRKGRILMPTPLSLEIDFMHISRCKITPILNEWV
jgi:hypothetical protein